MRMDNSDKNITCEMIPQELVNLNSCTKKVFSAVTSKVYTIVRCNTGYLLNSNIVFHALFLCFVWICVGLIEIDMGKHTDSPTKLWHVWVMYTNTNKFISGAKSIYMQAYIIYVKQVVNMNTDIKVHKKILYKTLKDFLKIL